MRILFLLAALLLAGCGTGPDEDTLKADVGARLAQALPEDTLSVVDFARRGSQSDTKAPGGETRRVLYFDAALKLERDFDFGAWDSPGVAGIVSALGTGPKGIVGIKSGGNKAGDILRAHGTALYTRGKDGWHAVVSGGYAPATAPAYATNTPHSDLAEILSSMRKIADSLPGNVSPATRRIITRELENARASMQAALARTDAGYVVAAGPEHGQYLRFAQALPDSDSIAIIPLVTRGGEENLRMLRDGRVQFALSQADAALDAYEGKGSFSAGGPYTTLRAVGSLYPEPVHIIVRADSAFGSVSDLANRIIAVGPVGSASRTTALRVLEAHGLGPTNIEIVDAPMGEALVDLRARKVDAVVQVIGVPADRVRDALAAIPLRLVPMTKAGVAKLTESGNGYFAYTIPHRTYAVQTEDVRTIATAALMLVGAGLSESEVHAATRYVFGAQRDFASRGSAQGTQVSAANARLGLSIPLHIGAEKVLEEMASGE
jgi:TRAP transporter TAXI family solute receptor